MSCFKVWPVDTIFKQHNLSFYFRCAPCRIKGAELLLEKAKKIYGDHPTAKFTATYLEYLEKSGRTVEAAELRKKRDDKIAKPRQNTKRGCPACGMG